MKHMTKTQREERVKLHIAKLPKLCFVVHPTTEEFIAVKAGELGYNKTTVYDWQHAKTLNDRLGVTNAQYHAMLHGSVFGFHIPMADPDNIVKWGYDKDPWEKFYTGK